MRISSPACLHRALGRADGIAAPQAMGNYPYPSPYILNGAGILPAFPVRVACSHLGQERLDTEEALLAGLAGERLNE